MSAYPTAAGAVSALSSHKTIYTRSSAAATATGDSGALTHSAKRVAVDISVTAATGTSPSMVPHLDRQMPNGVWARMWTGSAITVAGVTSANIGPGLTNAILPVGPIRLGWIITGTTPSFTFSASVQGI